MRTYSFLAGGALLALALTSCTDVVDLVVPRAAPQLVVDGAITDQPGPYVVRLTTTAPYFDSGATPPVTGATLVLRSDSGQVDTLRERRPGEYASCGVVRGRIGGRYTLDISSGGEHYQAATELRRAIVIDAIQAKYEPAVTGSLLAAGYYILLSAQEPAGRGDYFRFRVYQNGVLRNRPADLQVRDDKLVDGNYLKDFRLTSEPDQYPFVPGDRVRVEVNSLPADYYYFLQQVRTQLTAGGLFAPPPANVRTNVHNVQADSPSQAVGYFAGYTVRTDSLIVR